ncbi:unnamed protein product [Scytosiphon promiscuus]
MVVRAAGGEASEMAAAPVAAAAGGEDSPQQPSTVNPYDEGDPAPVDLWGGRHVVVLFDLETTGLSLKKHRVIQLAAKVMGSQDPSHVFSVFVEPEGAYLSQRIRKLTGITPRILAANNARPFREVWPRFASWLRAVAAKGGQGHGGGGVVLAAHNARFDRNFLVEEVSRAGFDRSTIIRAGVSGFVDTLAVLKDYTIWSQTRDENYGGGNVSEDGSTAAGSLPPPHPPGYKLGVLYEHIFGQEMPDAHTALADVEGLEAVLSSCGIAERWRRVASTPECQIPVLPPP